MDLVYVMEYMFFFRDMTWQAEESCSFYRWLLLRNTGETDIATLYGVGGGGDDDDQSDAMTTPR